MNVVADGAVGTIAAYWPPDPIMSYTLPPASHTSHLTSCTLIARLNLKPTPPSPSHRQPYHRLCQCHPRSCLYTPTMACLYTPTMPLSQLSATETGAGDPSALGLESS